MINELDRTHDIHVWRDYIPQEEHYVGYDPHIIYSSFKIEDVYYSIANARTHLVFYESENFGGLISTHDDLHLTFIKSRMLTSSLAFYNYAIDLSWQVLWYYWGDCTYLFMEDNELYEKYANHCNIKTLNERLSMYKDFNMKSLINLFFENSLTKEIRDNYNYIKHRGVMHTPGLGEQYSSSLLSVSFDGNESYSYSILQRKTFEIEEWFLKLIDFDKIFYLYFTQIINHVIPENFHKFQPDMTDFIKYSELRKHFLESELEIYKTKFMNFY